MAIVASQLIAAVSVTGAAAAKADLLGVGESATSAGGMLKGALVGAALGAGVALVGIGVASVKMAGNFQEGMTSLVTGAGESAKNIKTVRDGILQMAVDTGTSTKQLTDGMYMIESAGFHGKAGLDVLKAAAMGAKVGNADLGTVADATTTILKDFANTGITASGAVNTLVATVAAGKTHMQDLATSLSSVLPTASAAKVGLNDVMGAMATMTGEGVPAANAATYLRQMIMGLDAPSKKAQTALESIGLSSTQVAADMQKSLPATLQLITDHLKQKFPEGSAAYVAAVAAISGSSKTMQGMLDLTGQHMNDFKTNVGGLADAVKKGGNSITGWSDVQKDFNFKMDQARAVVEVLMIKIGTALLPVIGKLVDTITPLIAKFGDWVTKSNVIPNSIAAIGAGISNMIGFINGAISVIQSIISWYNQWSGIINTVGGIILGFFAPALIMAGVQATISGVKIATSFIVSMVQSGVQAVVSGAQVTASFVASVIKAGAEAWITGPKIIGSFVASMVTSGVQAIASAAKVTASFIASMVQAGAEAVVSGAKIVASFVASLITAGVQAVVAGAQIVASFVASLITTGAQAVVTGATMLASLIPAIASVVAEALVAAATAIPALIAGFVAWAVSAGAAAIATIAATWPILLIIAAIAALVVGIVLLVQHWGQVTDFLKTTWNTVVNWLIDSLHSVEKWFTDTWNTVIAWLKIAWNIITTDVRAGMTLFLSFLINPLGTLIILFSGPILNLAKWLDNWFNGLAKTALTWGMNLINSILHGIQNAWSNVVTWFQNALAWIAGLFPHSPVEHGPLQGIENWGKNITNALATSIKAGMPSVQSAFGSLALPGVSGSGATSFAGGSSSLLPGLAATQVGGGSFNGTQTIQILLDGQIIGEANGKYMAKQIRVQTGSRQST